MPTLSPYYSPPAPLPIHQPPNHGAQHTPWSPYRLVDSVTSSPSLLALLLFVAAFVLFICRRRLRNSCSRILSQAIEAATAPSLHIHIHGHGRSSSSHYTTVPDSPISPISAPLSPSTPHPPTMNTSGSPPTSRSMHIGATPNRPSAVQIAHIPTPSKVTNARTTSRGSLTPITFYPDSPTGSSTPSTPASECSTLSPQSETMPLTPRVSFEEEVKVVPSSPSPSLPVFSSSSPLDSFRIQTPVLPVPPQMHKPAPISVPDVSGFIDSVARPPSPTTTTSIHTTLPSQTIARARSGSAVPVPPNIVLTSVPRRPAQPKTPLSPPHTLAVPSVRSVRRQQQLPWRPVAPPAYEVPKKTVDMWVHPATAADPFRPRHHPRRHTLQRPPPPPPKPIIPFDLDPVYPSKEKEAEVTPAIGLRRLSPPSVKPVIPFELEPVYPEKRTERGQDDDYEDEDVETPTSATVFFKALVEKGKKEMQSLRKGMEEIGKEERRWGGISIGSRMSALAKRARRAVERELDSEDEEEEDVTLSPVSPVSAGSWPSSRVGIAEVQMVVMPLTADEVRREKEMVFVIGDEEDF